MKKRMESKYIPHTRNKSKQWSSDLDKQQNYAWRDGVSGGGGGGGEKKKEPN